MVSIATYDGNGNIIGCTRTDGVSGGLEFLADCEALGFTITYKTPAELQAMANVKAINGKWATYDAYCSDLTVTTDAMHQFAASKEALRVIATRRDSMLDTDSILWVESWDKFQTTRIELQEVIVKANTLTQAKITELFGGV